MTFDATVLIHTFRHAIRDLTAKLATEGGTMSTADRENTQYVIGMAAVNSFNLEQVIERGPGYYRANKDKVDRFHAEAAVFAKALRANGFD